MIFDIIGLTDFRGLKNSFQKLSSQHISRHFHLDPKFSDFLIFIIASKISAKESLVLSKFHFDIGIYRTYLNISYKVVRKDLKFRY